MTVFELHLAIEQKLQEQGSFRRDRIFPEAIDFALVEAEKQLIADYTEKNFADWEKRQRALLPLMVNGYTKPTDEAVSGLGSTIYRSVDVPADLFYIVSGEAEVTTSKTDCDVAPTDLALSIQPKYRTVVSFPISNLGSGPFYTGFKIVKSTNVTLYTTPAAFASRFMEKEQRYEIINEVLDYFNTPNSQTQVYWEYYAGVYYPGSFIFISSVPLTSLTITIYQSNGVTVDATSSGTEVSMAKNVINRTALGQNTTVIRTVKPLKQLEMSLKSKVQINSFTKTKKTEPQFFRNQDSITIIEDISFIVTGVTLNYIRKPKVISLLLNKTSELDPSVHNELVSRAVEILKMNIQDQSISGDIQYNRVTTRI